MLKAIPFVIVLATACFAQSVANDETQVWSLEKAYWEYVKTNDLEKYRTLWHELRWLAICQLRACAERSHHRLDHDKHVERCEVAVVFDRATSDSRDWRRRDQLLSNQS